MFSNSNSDSQTDKTLCDFMSNLKIEPLEYFVLMKKSKRKHV